MCIAKSTPYIRRQIVAETTTTTPKILLPWMLRPGAVTGRVTNELREITTNGTFTQECNAHPSHEERCGGTGDLLS